MRRSALILLSLMPLISAAGVSCATIPQTHYYVLALGGNAAPPAPHNPVKRRGLEIGVKTFLVDPPYDQDRIVYRVGSRSAEVGFYSYHRWAVPLSRMLPNVVAEGLSGTPGVALIEPVMPGHPYNALLEGRVLSLEEIDMPEGHKAQIRLTMTLRLQDGTVAWSDTITGEATTQTGTVGAVVEQMRAALAAVLDTGRKGLASALEDMVQMP